MRSFAPQRILSSPPCRDRSDGVCLSVVEATPGDDLCRVAPGWTYTNVCRASATAATRRERRSCAGGQASTVGGNVATKAGYSPTMASMNTKEERTASRSSTSGLHPAAVRP
jgi:hypothetical protein